MGVDLVTVVLRRREQEHEEAMARMEAKDLQPAGRLSNSQRMLLLTRVRVYGWPVVKAAASVGVSKQAAYYLLAKSRTVPAAR
jgi:predicted hotdog family 3-hydroxylacyl-ACP dehydratase